MPESRFEGKSYVIPRQLVWNAWLKVREKGGSAGADGVTIKQFEEGSKDRLYVLWNRMSSGSYLPGPVRAVDIPKKEGGRGGSAFRMSLTESHRQWRRWRWSPTWARSPACRYRVGTSPR
jgi:hypothetical protein